MRLQLNTAMAAEVDFALRDRCYELARRTKEWAGSEGICSCYVRTIREIAQLRREIRRKQEAA